MKAHPTFHTTELNSKRAVLPCARGTGVDAEPACWALHIPQNCALPLLPVDSLLTICMILRVCAAPRFVTST